MRLSLLLSLLAVVLLWAWRDVRSRRERNTWARPLAIAIVLVRGGPIDVDAVDAFRSRVPALDARLAEECHRYRPEPSAPFTFTFVGPVDGCPRAPAPSDGWLGAVKFAWDRWRWTSNVDRRAGLDPSDYDSRVYVVARPPENAAHEMVEGESEQGGRVGIVEVELDASMADFALFVTAHELLHTLGATDKYDAAGRTLVPSGLVEPDRTPLYPQSSAEVMARNLPLAPDVERPPTSLDELGVGAVTAAEIRWIRAPR